MAKKWQTLWLGDMTAAQMRKFILFQNTYSSDGFTKWHSAESLARFCDLEPDHPKYPQFLKVHAKLTREYKEAAE